MIFSVFVKLFLKKNTYLYFVMSFFVFLIIFSLLHIMKSYESSFNQYILSKQAHIYIKKSDKTPIHLTPKLVNSIDKAISHHSKYSINSYVERKIDLRLIAQGYAGLDDAPTLDGEVFLVGISPDIANIIPMVKIKNFDSLSKTSSCDTNKLINNFYEYRDKNVVLLNSYALAIFTGYSGLTQNITKASAFINGKRFEAWILGKYDDFDKVPRIYVNKTVADSWLNTSPSEATGIMIKLKEASKIQKVTTILKETPSLSKFTITSILDENSKKAKITQSISEFVRNTIVSILLVSNILLVLWQYGMILDKQPQIRLLYNLGIDISNKIIGLFCLIYAFIAVLAYYSSIFVAKKISVFLHIQIQFSVFDDSFVLGMVIVVFLFVFALLSKVAFQIKTQIK